MSTRSVCSRPRVLVVPGHHVLEVADPDHVVGVLAGHRDAGETAAEREGERLADGLVVLDEDHVGARDHDLADDRVAELEDRADHLAFAWLDFVLGLDVVDQVVHAGPAVELGIAAVAAERERARHRVERPGERAQRPAQRAEQAVRGPGHPLGALPAHRPRADADQRVPWRAGAAPAAGRNTCQPPPSQCPNASVTRTAADTSAHDPQQRQQAAVPVKPVGVDPGHGRLRARAPAGDARSARWRATSSQPAADIRRDLPVLPRTPAAPPPGRRLPGRRLPARQTPGRGPRTARWRAARPRPARRCGLGGRGLGDGQVGAGWGRRRTARGSADSRRQSRSSSFWRPNISASSSGSAWS